MSPQVGGSVLVYSPDFGRASYGTLNVENEDGTVDVSIHATGEDESEVVPLRLRHPSWWWARLSDEDKVELADATKKEGNALFGAKSFRDAAEVYRFVAGYLLFEFDWEALQRPRPVFVPALLAELEVGQAVHVLRPGRSDALGDADVRPAMVELVDEEEATVDVLYDGQGKSATLYCSQ